MTKEEALKLAKKWFEHNTYSDEADEVYEAIEQALAQPEQEPVAYWNFNNGFSHCMIDQLNEAAKKNPAPLYTTPPQRTWVGLTDDEFEDIELGCRSTPFGKIEAMKKVEAKLKEKQ